MKDIVRVFESIPRARVTAAHFEASVVASPRLRFRPDVARANSCVVVIACFACAMEI